MRLIVGLGNVGREYEQTRHNVGFLAVERLAVAHRFSSWRDEKKFFGSVATGQLGTEKTILLRPSTLMNLSGKSVAAVANFYKISPEKIWIWQDDVDQDFGKIRIRTGGSHGGHNGIRSVIAGIGTQDFSRLKWGIANELREKMPTDRFVLGRFSTEEWSALPELLVAGIAKFLTHEKC